jgi:hypothetical protein
MIQRESGYSTTQEQTLLQITRSYGSYCQPSSVTHTFGLPGFAVQSSRAERLSSLNEKRFRIFFSTKRDPEYGSEMSAQCNSENMKLKLLRACTWLFKMQAKSDMKTAGTAGTGLSSLGMIDQNKKSNAITEHAKLATLEVR